MELMGDSHHHHHRNWIGICVMITISLLFLKGVVAEVIPVDTPSPITPFVVPKLSVSERLILVHDDPLVDSEFVNGEILTKEQIRYNKKEERKVKFLRAKTPSKSGLKLDLKELKGKAKNRKIHVGSESDIYQIVDIIVYEHEGINCTASLFYANGSLTEGVAWVLGESNKFGANISNMSDLADLEYVLECNQEIFDNNMWSYVKTIKNVLSSLNKEGLVEERHIFDFTDVCTRAWDCVNDTCDTPANCSFSYWSEGGSYFMGVEFVSDSFIDPKVSISVFDGTSSTEDNVTNELEYSHLTMLPLEGLLYHWNFDADKNVTVRDLTANNEDGTLYGDAFMNKSFGVIGASLQLDGHGDYMDTITSDDWAGWNFTLCGWARPIGGLAVANRLMFARHLSSSQKNFQVGIETNGYVMHQTYASCSSGPTALYSTTPLTVTKWYHVCWVLENGVKKEIWLDGKLNISSASVAYIPSGCSQKLTIGANARNPTDTSVNATLDELMVFNRPLNSSEIVSIYEFGVHRFYSNGVQSFELLNLSVVPNQTGVNITLGMQNFNGTFINGTLYFNDSVNWNQSSGGFKNFDVINLTHYGTFFPAPNVSDYLLELHFYANSYYSPALQEIVLENSFQPTTTTTLPSAPQIGGCSANQTEVLQGEVVDVSASISNITFGLDVFSIWLNLSLKNWTQAVNGTNSLLWVTTIEEGNYSLLCNVTDVGNLTNVSSGQWITVYTTTTTTLCDACQELLLDAMQNITIAIENQTDILHQDLVNISVTLSQQTELISFEFNLTRIYIGEALTNQTDSLVTITINQSDRIIYAIGNQTDAQWNMTNVIVTTIINESNETQSLIDDGNRWLRLISMKLSNMLQFDMRENAHYRVLVTDTNCSFNPTDIILEKYTIGKAFIPSYELEDGLYCFVVQEYDPDSDTYGLLSDPRRLYINNTCGG